MNDGFSGTCIGVDFSSAIIQSLRKKRRNITGISYEVMDARKLTYAPQSASFIIDKGTIDAMLCSKDWSRNVNQIFTCMCRTLSKDGHIMIVSHLDFDSEEFQDILSNTIVPVLSEDPSRAWGLDVHEVRNGDVGEDEGEDSRASFATVYILYSRERRITRSVLAGTSLPIPLEIKILSYDGEGEEEGEEEEEGEGT